MSRCTHTHGRTLCFECFRAGMERTRARREAWAQRSLPFDEAASPSARRRSRASCCGTRRPCIPSRSSTWRPPAAAGLKQEKREEQEDFSRTVRRTLPFLLFERVYLLTRQPRVA